MALHQSLQATRETVTRISQWLPDVALSPPMRPRNPIDPSRLSNPPANSAPGLLNPTLLNSNALALHEHSATSAYYAGASPFIRPPALKVEMSSPVSSNAASSPKSWVTAPSPPPSNAVTPFPAGSPNMATSGLGRYSGPSSQEHLSSASPSFPTHSRARSEGSNGSFRSIGRAAKESHKTASIIFLDTVLKSATLYISGFPLASATGPLPGYPTTNISPQSATSSQNTHQPQHQSYSYDSNATVIPTSIGRPLAHPYIDVTGSGTIYDLVSPMATNFPYLPSGLDFGPQETQLTGGPIQVSPSASWLDELSSSFDPAASLAATADLGSPYTTTHAPMDIRGQPEPESPELNAAREIADLAASALAHPTVFSELDMMIGMVWIQAARAIESELREKARTRSAVSSQALLSTGSGSFRSEHPSDSSASASGSSGSRRPSPHPLSYMAHDYSSYVVPQNPYMHPIVQPIHHHPASFPMDYRITHDSPDPQSPYSTYSPYSIPLPHSPAVSSPRTSTQEHSSFNSFSSHAEHEHEILKEQRDVLIRALDKLGDMYDLIGFLRSH